MRVTRQNWWMFLAQPIVGFDEGTPAGEGGTGAGEGASGEGANGAGEGAGEGQGAPGTGDEGQGADDPAAGLKSALQKERADRKAMEKELKALRAEKQTAADAELSEVERLKKENETSAGKTAKLAQGFRKNAVNEAILKAAAAAKFRDPSDALRPEVMDALGVEQDEDDPSNVTIDSATVTAAIKALAKSKPHYLATEQKQTTPKSGSQFGGSGGGSNLTADQQALAARYPALRGRI